MLSISVLAKEAVNSVVGVADSRLPLLKSSVMAKAAIMASASAPLAEGDARGVLLDEGLGWARSWYRPTGSGRLSSFTRGRSSSCGRCH